MQRRLLHPHHYLRHLPPHTLALFLPPASPPLHLPPPPPPFPPPPHFTSSSMLSPPPLISSSSSSCSTPSDLYALCFARPRDSTSLLEPKFPMVGSPQAPSYPMAAVPTLLLCGSLGFGSFQDFFPLQSQLRRTSRYWRGGFVTLVTHSGFIINTHNQSVRQENALELFLWRWCKIRNNFLSNIPSGAKSYYPRHLFKKIQPPQNVKWKCFLEFSIVSGPASRLSHIHYSTLSALLQLSFQTFSLAGALSDFYIVSFWSNILLRSQHMAWFNQIRQCVFHWPI